MMFQLVICSLLLSSLVIAQESSTYKAKDISKITLYGSTAEYRPELCPESITFTARARPMRGMNNGGLGILPKEMQINGEICKADSKVIGFAPIEKVPHLPPQWLFEDGMMKDHPVNFTCGPNSYSIRFGFFNDVKTKTTSGFLDPKVVYLDFAVIPNTTPFGFCSYASRREDGGRPIDYAPFPTAKLWKSLLATGPQMMPEASSSPKEEELMEITSEPSDKINEGTPKPIKKETLPSVEIPEPTAFPMMRQVQIDDPFREAIPVKIEIV